MSDNEKGHKYTPARMNIDELERLTRLFKDIFAEQPLIKWSIYLAGFGGLLEGLHIIWLVIKDLRH